MATQQSMDEKPPKSSFLVVLLGIILFILFAEHRRDARFEGLFKSDLDVLYFVTDKLRQVVFREFLTLAGLIDFFYFDDFAHRHIDRHHDLLLLGSTYAFGSTFEA